MVNSNRSVYTLQCLFSEILLASDGIGNVQKREELVGVFHEYSITVKFLPKVNVFVSTCKFVYANLTAKLQLILS